MCLLLTGSFPFFHLLVFAMTNVREHCCCITFCFTFDKIATEMNKSLVPTFSNNALGQDWFKHFKNVWISVDDDEHLGLTSTSITSENVSSVWNVIMKDCRETIHNICNIGKLYGTCQQNLSEILNMIKIVAKFMLRLHMNVCRESKELTWIFFLRLLQVTKVGFVDTTAKLNSNHSGGRAYLHLSQIKLLKFRVTWNPYWSVSLILIGLFTRSSYLVIRQLMVVYHAILWWLMESIWRKLPKKWHRNDWVLNHDNEKTRYMWFCNKESCI